MRAAYHKPEHWWQTTFIQSIPLPSTTSNIQPTHIRKTNTHVSLKVNHVNKNACVCVLSFISFTDKEWTKEETDYLFSVARDFDLRWYVIHDRYEYPEGPSRSLEVFHSFTTVSV